MSNNELIRNRVSLLILIAVCLAGFFLLFPTVNNNADDPNLIAYFNADEGWLTDLVWSFYSGEKRPSYQADFDVGIGLLYLADLAKLILSKFMLITPGTFVLILRWLYIFSWIGALIALWRMVGFHFGKGWQPAFVVLLLAVRPALAYFSINLKADPLVLLITIIGLDYALRLISTPNRKYIYAACACASLAFVIKYAGIFLLPVVIFALFLSESYSARYLKKAPLFPDVPCSCAVYPALGGILIILPVIMLMFYVRKSTGTTWAEEYGLWGSVLRNKPIFYLWAMGAAGIMFYPLVWWLGKTGISLFQAIYRFVKKITGHVFIASMIFALFTLLFGLKWVLSPRYFITTYAQLGPTFLGTTPIFMIENKGLFHVFLDNITAKFINFDPVIITLIVFYLFMEILHFKKRKTEAEALRAYKRYALLIFLIPLFMLAVSMGRIEAHHILPFFAVMAILTTEGIYMFYVRMGNKYFLRNIGMFVFGVLLLADITVNGYRMAVSRIHEFYQRDDIAIDIGDWLEANIPKDAKIAADHYLRVYIPPGYNKVRTLAWNDKNKTDSMRKLIDGYHPEYVYYNLKEANEPKLSMPLLEEMAKGRKVTMLKRFYSDSKVYRRNPGGVFVIYRIEY